MQATCKVSISRPFSSVSNTRVARRCVAVTAQAAPKPDSNGVSGRRYVTMNHILRQLVLLSTIDPNTSTILIISSR